MKKFICGFLFYAAVISAMVLFLNNSSLFLSFLGLVIMFILMNFAKAFGKEFMFELMGINWLQSKFNNNPVIMDMTNE